MRRLLRRVSLALVLCLGFPGIVGGLEVREGRMKLVLHEDIGRYSLYYLTDLQKGTYLPLLVDTDPRTSGTSLVVDGRVSRLGESSDFQQTARRTAAGAEFVWTSRILEVTQTLEFTRSAAAQLADGVKVTLTARNLGEKQLQIGARVLMDTYLGEEGSYHFVLDGQKQLARETDLVGASLPGYWVSPLHSSSSGVGLLCLTVGEGATTPDRLVFANWQRLNDSSWSFQSSSTRTFTNLPYSINDSAVAHYHDPRAVRGGEKLTIVTLFGSSASASPLASTSGAAGQAADQTGGALLDAVASTSGISDPTIAAAADLKVLNSLIDSLDAHIGNPEGLTEDELKTLTSVLKELQSRVGRYAVEGEGATSTSP